MHFIQNDVKNLGDSSVTVTEMIVSDCWKSANVDEHSHSFFPLQFEDFYAIKRV